MRLGDFAQQHRERLNGERIIFLRHHAPDASHDWLARTDAKLAAQFGRRARVVGVVRERDAVPHDRERGSAEEKAARLLRACHVIGGIALPDGVEGYVTQTMQRVVGTAVEVAVQHAMLNPHTFCLAQDAERRVGHMAVHDVVARAVLRYDGVDLADEPSEIMAGIVHAVDAMPERLELLVEAFLVVRHAVVLGVVEDVVVDARLVARDRHVVDEARHPCRPIQ